MNDASSPAPPASVSAAVAPDQPTGTPAPSPAAPTGAVTAASGAAAPAQATRASAPTRWILAALAALAAAALGLAWNTQQRLKTAEQEIVKRQQDAGTQAAEARLMARQAEAAARENAAKVALLEARVAETSLQRSQLEELIQSLSRSRDENVLSDVEAALRLALQQAAITGSAEPLLSALRQAEERLARYPQPRMERVRRAVLQDLDRVKAAGTVDVQSLAIRIDESVRAVDDLPLLAAIDRRGVSREGLARGPAASAPAGPAGVGAASSPGPQWLDARVRSLLGQFWEEVRGLVRVTRVDDPEAALLAPEQAFFLRENLKLRLLNARLALLSRQFDTAQADLREAQAVLDRYFDKGSRRVDLVREQLGQVAQQARQVSVPRPDATLAVLATAVAGR
ncbi:MAG: uroporphyrinogen-III C-methyltransferase [Rubrivivax sp.]